MKQLFIMIFLLILVLLLDVLWIITLPGKWINDLLSDLIGDVTLYGDSTVFKD